VPTASPEEWFWTLPDTVRSTIPRGDGGVKEVSAEEPKTRGVPAPWQRGNNYPYIVSMTELTQCAFKRALMFPITADFACGSVVLFLLFHKIFARCAKIL